MKIRWLLVGLLWAACAWCADPIVAPLKKSGSQLGVFVTRTRNEPQVREITVNVNGAIEVRKVTVNVPVTVTQVITMDPKAGDPFDIDGKPLDAKQVSERAKEGVVVAIVAGKAPDAEMRKKFAEQKVQLILVTKEEPTKPVPPLPPPPPPPPPLPPPPPSFNVATKPKLADGKLTVTMPVTQLQQVAVIEKRKGIVGKEVEVTVLKTVPITKEVTVVYELKELMFQTPQGKNIPIADVEKMLTDKTKLLIADVVNPPTEKQVASYKDIDMIVLRGPPAKKPAE